MQQKVVFMLIIRSKIINKPNPVNKYMYFEAKLCQQYVFQDQVHFVIDAKRTFLGSYF